MVKYISKLINGEELYYLKDTEARANLIDKSEKGAASGVATLDSSGKVPSSQLPSYVDDVIEGYYHNNEFYTTYTPGEEGQEDTYSGEITPEQGKIYVDIPTNQSYRWSGSTYIVISSPYVLPTASANTLGGVKIGGGLSIDSNGVLSAEEQEVEIGNTAPTGTPKLFVDEDADPAASYDVYTRAQTDSMLTGKVDKVTGKGLSTNDYTTEEKTKLAGIAAGAEANVNADWNAVSGDAQILNKPTSLPASDVSTWAKASTKPSYTLDEVSDGSSRKLANYLPLSGGTLTGELVLKPSSSSETSILKCKAGEWFDQNFNLHLAASSGSWNLFNNNSEEIITAKRSSGNVGIGNSSPSYKFHVNGEVGATNYNNTSDIRKKDIIENLDLDVEDIANAPLFKFSWLDPEMPEGVNVGTSAQYWQTIMPEIVTETNDDEKTLSMQYGVAGLASSIALAKKVVEQENTIKAQEARIKALEDAIAEIQNKLK